MSNKQNKIALLAIASMTLVMAGCSSDNDPVPEGGGNLFEKPTKYTGFPITLKDAPTPDGVTSSTSYPGQMARGVLRESVKAVIKAPVGSSKLEIMTEVNALIKNESNVIDDQVIAAPKTKNEFIVKETIHNELGTSKNLYAKLYDTTGQGDPIPGVAEGDKATTLGVPGTVTAQQHIDRWVENLGELQNGAGGYTDPVTGYNYNQLFPKYLFGAVFYNQSVDKYLDEFLVEPGTKDNDAPYKDGKYYTGKEHSWDEGFGWFGAAANYGELTATQNHAIKKMGTGSITAAMALANADWNTDGSVSLLTEYTSGPAYYAASFDKDGNSTYGADIMGAWLTGRTVIANAVDADGNARKLTDAERTELIGYAATIQSNWEMVFAEAVYKYAGIAHDDIEAIDSGAATDADDYYKHWSELKGFMLSLQYGGANSKITKAKFEEIDNLIGFGPVKEDGSQVDGVDGSNHFTMSAADGAAFVAYKAKLKSVQTIIDAFYTLKAKQDAIP